MALFGFTALCQRQQDKGEHHAVLITNHQLLKLAPWDEAAHQRQMLLLAAFIGREAELKFIRAQLVTAICRLLWMQQALVAYENSWSRLQDADASAAARCLARWGGSIRGHDPQRSLALLKEGMCLMPRLDWPTLRYIKPGQNKMLQNKTQQPWMKGNASAQRQPFNSSTNIRRPHKRSVTVLINY